MSSVPGSRRGALGFYLRQQNVADHLDYHRAHSDLHSGHMLGGVLALWDLDDEGRREGARSDELSCFVAWFGVVNPI